MSATKFMLILIGFVLTSLVVCIIFSFAVISISKHMENKRNRPIKNIKGKVIDKKVDIAGFNSPRMCHYIIFELENGGSMELLTYNGRDYKLLNEGDVGIISYQDHWFKKFHKFK